MNNKGFTLVELLAVIVVLGIITGIVIVSSNVDFGKAKSKTEDIYVKTLEDALKIYLDSDAKKLSYGSTSVFSLSKTHGSVNLYKNTTSITFNNIINSDYSPLVASDLVNPNNEEAICNKNAPVTIFRDGDYVYYYLMKKSDFQCLKNVNIDDSMDIINYITNLPCDYLQSKNYTNLGNRCS